MSRWWELNSWPLPYQGSALPLSYTGLKLIWSGRRGSNPRPSAWKADALPTELLPHKKSGESRIRTYEGVSQQIYSLPQLATLVSPHLVQSSKQLWSRWRDSNPRPADYKSAALANWATSAIIQELSFPFWIWDCKYITLLFIYQTFF